MRLFFAIISSLVLSCHVALADVGMWIPLFIDRNISTMQQNGCHLSAEDIYSINNASLKDAVVIFGGGCTGEVVSSEGLLLTNHHCGYSAIQRLSSVEHDYLSNGFWAMNKDEELPCEGLSVQFLVSIDDVTSQVLKGSEAIPADSVELLANHIVNNIDAITEQAQEDNPSLNVEVESFYGGNQFLLFKYKVYTDIRLVGTPPDNLGRFGGDTDNWVWPRHTCDFSMFRIYADKDNNPASYSADNVPFKPARHLQISTKGVAEGDFTMVMGYPGSTNLYAPSCYVELIQKVINPKNVQIRTAKLKVMNKYQATSQLINIQYAAKNASTSNAWKKWQGEVKGLVKTNAVANKRIVEQNLIQRKPEAKVLLDQYAAIYNDNYANYYVHAQYISELLSRGGVELFQIVRNLDRDNGSGPQKTIDDFYRDFNYDLSREMAIEVLNVYCRNIPRHMWPEALQKAKSIDDLVNNVYAKSAFRSAETANKLLAKNKDKFKFAVRKDPAYQLYSQFDILSGKLKDIYGINTPWYTTEYLNMQYTKAMLDAYPDSLMPSNANFTMRVSYGKMAGYEADDAIQYAAFTTLDGIIEKYNTGNADYQLPQRLIDLYESKAYADYADPSDGKLHTAFVATNHTTGGNSGSPVLNADGQLIGLNFDRAWNGVMSDLYFNPLQCRNITLDIRYLLFIVARYGNARYLVDEMLRDK